MIEYEEKEYVSELEWLHSARGKGVKNGLNGIRHLLEELGNPQKFLKTVHVVGTNGKGSVSTMTAAILTNSGLRTGLYISPFVDDFRERLQINGEYISKKDFVIFAKKIQEIIPAFLEKGWDYPTEFEVLTALALLYFKEKNCDILVLEAGIGGKNDATNVIDDPVVAVISTISLDHTDVLGDTITKIAEQKCGVIKPKSIVVTCPMQNEEALSVIKKTCLEKGTSLIVPDMPNESDYECALDGSRLFYKGLSLVIPLAGKYQIQNTVTAVETAFALMFAGFSISKDSITSGIAKTKFNGRLEIISKDPLFIIDGSHNPQGVDSLTDYIDSFLGKYKKIIILAMLKDKNYKTCIPKIAKRADLLIAVEADTFRTLSAEETANIARTYCKNIVIASDVSSATEMAFRICNENNKYCILSCGSLYLPGAVRYSIA